MYSIIDIETTGGNSKTGKITEIAVFVHNGTRIVTEFCTLLNPQQRIPPFISKLTGITQQMVDEAPLFEEVAAYIAEITANTIFVAHNVNFDYGFIREEYRRIGQEFRRRRLCTVQMSRMSFPGLKSYSLGKITSELNITLKNSHRAGHDALATVHLFEKIMQQQSQVGLFDMHYGKADFSGINSPLLNEQILESIPDETGVLRFYNRQDELIYTKRGAHLRETAIEKLKPDASKTTKSFREELYRIEAVVTGSAMMAQLLEMQDVVSMKPKYNFGRASVRVAFGLDLVETAGNWHITINRNTQCCSPLMKFSSFGEALKQLHELARVLHLPVRERSQGRNKTVLLHIHEGHFQQLESLLNFGSRSFLIIDEGRRADERLALLVLDGAICGYNYIPFDMAIDDIHAFAETLTPLENSLENIAVLSKFLYKDNVERLINFELQS